MASASCQSCGQKGLATKPAQCANKARCGKPGINVCQGCLANAVNMRQAIRCLSCRRLAERGKKKKGVGISSHPK